MKVTELISRLKAIESYGYGDSEVLIWDPDSEDWEPITCLTYGDFMPVMLYSDEP